MTKIEIWKCRHEKDRVCHDCVNDLMSLLEAERERYQKLTGKYDIAHSKWRGYLLDKKGSPICLEKDAEREQAKFALAVYGNHLPNCPIRPKCACGFLKALGMREPVE